MKYLLTTKYVRNHMDIIELSRKDTLGFMNFIKICSYKVRFMCKKNCNQFDKEVQNVHIVKWRMTWLYDQSGAVFTSITHCLYTLMSTTSLRSLNQVSIYFVWWTWCIFLNKSTTMCFYAGILEAFRIQWQCNL